MHKDGWNITKSQRRYVESIYKEVNKRQRHDVATSRRQREFLLLIIKRQMGTELEGIEDWESYEPGCRNQSSSDIDLGEEPVICTFLCFGY